MGKRKRRRQELIDPEYQRQESGKANEGTSEPDEGLQLARTGELERLAEANQDPEEAATALVPKAKARTRKTPESRPCACGCGQPTARSFAPGHDQRLWGVAQRVGSGKLEPAEGKKMLDVFPKETIKANRDHLNALAGLDLV